MINLETSVWFMVAHGSTVRGIYDHRTGSGASLSAGATPSAFVLPRTPPNPLFFVLLPFSLSCSFIFSSHVPIVSLNIVEHDMRSVFSSYGGVATPQKMKYILDSVIPAEAGIQTTVPA